MVAGVAGPVFVKPGSNRADFNVYLGGDGDALHKQLYATVRKLHETNPNYDPKGGAHQSIIGCCDGCKIGALGWANYDEAQVLFSHNTPPGSKNLEETRILAALCAVGLVVAMKERLKGPKEGHAANSPPSSTSGFGDVVDGSMLADMMIQGRGRLIVRDGKPTFTKR